MGVLRIERDAPTGIAARVGGVAWRDFDLQLFVYAVLLATLGLTMAYSNTAAQLARPLARSCSNRPCLQRRTATANA